MKHSLLAAVILLALSNLGCLVNTPSGPQECVYYPKESHVECAPVLKAKLP